MRAPGKFSGENQKRHICEGGVRFARPAPASPIVTEEDRRAKRRARPLQTLRCGPQASWLMRCCARLESGWQCPKSVGKCIAGALTKTMAKEALLELALASGWRPKSGPVWRAKQWLCPKHAAEHHGAHSKLMLTARRNLDG